MTTTYRIIPSTRHESGAHFEWTSDDDLAGAGNEFVAFDTAAIAASAMNKTSPVDGGKWLVCKAVDGRTFRIW